ncbi:hypothetical protein NC99_16920 [Sunxiuqinia dokdonensis]|uniref:Uncharacterized protein n=1 Tax=Sunxiuqinia dokdonensis TaxID=1409788 RepID=A0A0L8VBA5_9BACT|nr:hypothetical protein NC99_16920 [Sunxiuqinia dokdonensis]
MKNHAGHAKGGERCLYDSIHRNKFYTKIAKCFMLLKIVL